MSDSESIVEQEPPINTDKFKEYVRELIKIHDRIAEIRKDTSILNKRKKEIGAKIMTYMKSNDKELCNLGTQGTLTMKVTKTSQALKKEDIEELLQQFGNDETKAKETAQFLFENKRKKETSTLRRSTKVID
jgi:(p)ppGpp synthase/HD superfamily hydrolase